MSSFITILLISISISMDAFSLSLAYGLIGISTKNKQILSLIVGIYHFIMPAIGLILGTLISKISFLNLDLIAAIILIYIGIELIISNLKEENLFLVNIQSFLLFGLSVSIDSLSIGIGLKAITNNYIIALIMFSTTSYIFTYLGLILGNIISKKIGYYSKTAGGIILIIIAVILFIK